MSTNSESHQKIADSIKKLQSPIVGEDDFDHEIALRVLVNESAVNEQARAYARDIKGIPVLVKYLSSSNDVLVMLAALALSNLALDEDNQIAIADQGTIPHIARIIQDSIKRSGGEATDVNEDVLVKSIHLLTNLTLAQSNLDAVVSNNLIPLLIQLLKTFIHNPEIIGETTKPLRNLMLREDLQAQFVNADNISHLNAILSTTDENIQENSALLISVLAAFDDETRKMIIDLGILSMLGNFLGSSHAVKTATLTALNNLSLADEYESNFLSVVPPVVNLLYSSHEDLQESAAALLGNLCSSDSVRSCVQQSSGEVLSVALLQSPSLKVKEAASRLIGNLALDDKMRRRLVMCGAKDSLTAYEKALKSVKTPPEDLDVDEVLDVVASAMENLSVGSDDEIIESLPAGSLLEFGGRREKIVKEILETEKSYVASLNICGKHFSQPLSDFRTITKEEWNAIFGDIQSLISVNTSLLNQLQNRTANWSPQASLISDIFIEASKNLRNYDKYINNYDNAIKCFNEAYKRETFKAFIDKAVLLPEVRLNSLQSFLIMPVQRVPRYILLLQDLQKSTPQTHKDHELLIEALKQMKEVADYLNEEKRKADKQQRYMTLKRNLTLSSGQIAALFTPTRELIDEGELVLASGNKSKKSSKYVHVFLFNDLFVYSTKNKDKFKVQDKIQFDDASFQLENLNDTDVLTNSFKIYGSNTELIFSAATGSEKSRWVKSIVTQHRAYKATKNLQKSPSMTLDSKTAEEYKQQLANQQKSQTMK